MVSIATFETRSASICSASPPLASRTGSPSVTGWPFTVTVICAGPTDSRVAGSPSRL